MSSNVNPGPKKTVPTFNSQEEMNSAIEAAGIAAAASRLAFEVVSSRGAYIHHHSVKAQVKFAALAALFLVATCLFVWDFSVAGFATLVLAGVTGFTVLAYYSRVIIGWKAKRSALTQETVGAALKGDLGAKPAQWVNAPELLEAGLDDWLKANLSEAARETASKLALEFEGDLAGLLDVSRALEG